MIAKWGPRHPISLAAHRGLITKTAENVYDRRRVEIAVIEAFLNARDEIPKIREKIIASRLFDDDDPPLPETQPGQMPARPFEIMIARKFVRNPVADPRKDVSGSNGSRSASQPSIEYCPWLQRPFHNRLETLAALFRTEEADRLGLASPGPVAGGSEDVDTIWPRATDPALFAEVEHLRELFEAEDDRRQLLMLTSVGSYTSRARLEAVEPLQGLVQDQRQMRMIAGLAIGLAGLLATPFTGGKSVVVAGIICAAITADQAADDIAAWLAAKQFSAAAVDEVTAAYWTEPAIADLLGTLLAAGFDISSALVTKGTAAAVLLAAGLLMLLPQVGDIVALLREADEEP
jgi:uncharacterized membrane protein